MRKIKFRGQRVDTLEFVYGDLVRNLLTGSYAILTRYDGLIEVIPDTIGQFTGIYDNKRTDEYPNGQPIYEGDLVKSGYQENEEWIEAIATITWDDEYACFIQRINEKLEQCMDVICVVIGNIHERNNI